MAKKIINGRMYNTDTTEVLGSWDNGYPRGDFSFEEQTLHKKKTGEYFVYAYWMYRGDELCLAMNVMEDMIALVKNLSRCLWNRLSNGRKNI